MMMHALGIRSWGKVQNLELLEIPKPQILEPDQILIQVKATSLNGFDAVRLQGYSRLFETITLPVIPGMDYAGTVSAVGTSITKFKPGDAVYGVTLSGGACAEFLLLSSKFSYSIAALPPSLTFTEAASLPAVSNTVLCSLLRAEKELPGGLKGKTVLVPAGLSGTGSIALQLLKPVFGAGKVITTVSTKKVALVEKLLGEGLVDLVVDYTKQDVVQEIGKENVDFMFDTANMALSYISVLKPAGAGVIYTITGKSGTTMKKDWPELIALVRLLMDLVVWYYVWRARRWGVRYEEVYVQFTEEVAEKISDLIREGKLKAIVGRTAKMAELETVKEMFGLVVAGKGGIGKYVVSID